MFTFEQLVFALALASGLGSGLVAGVFFAFSAFVMKALARLPASEGTAAMQSINITVLNPWFLGAFLGTAALCLIAVVVSVFRWQAPNAVFLLGGGTAYLVGTFAVTIVFNVPRNNALALVSSGDPDSDSRWNEYVSTWTAWNHVRTVAAFIAAACFSFAIWNGVSS